MQFLSGLKHLFKKKKLIMTLLVRDEQEIIETNIQYHLSVGVDFFIITDNNSIASTPDIVQKYVDKGLAVLIRETDDNFHQSKWVTRMARMAYSEYNAGWVINNDADEFWWVDNHNLKKTLETTSYNVDVVVANRHNFITRKEINTPFYQAMDIKHSISTNVLNSPLPPKVIHRGKASIEIENGNHNVSGLGLKNKITSNEIEVFHFPMRNYKQFELKITNGGSSIIKNTMLPKNTGRTWLHLYDMHKEGKLQNYYNECLFSENEIESMIKENKLIKDERLKKYITNISNQWE